MRRVHLRGRENILKRLLIHIAGFNLSLVLRLMTGKGTPRGLQDLATIYFFTLIVLVNPSWQVLDAVGDSTEPRMLTSTHQRLSLIELGNRHYCHGLLGRYLPLQARTSSPGITFSMAAKAPPALA